MMFKVCYYLIRVDTLCCLGKNDVQMRSVGLFKNNKESQVTSVFHDIHCLLLTTLNMVMP